MSENAEILFTNETFYHVFRTRDLGAMDAPWARRAPVACVPPGRHTPPTPAAGR